MKPLSRSASIIFCDDVREETSGMKTIVGVYSTDLLVDEFPYSFPKLVAYVNFNFDLKDPINTFATKIYADNDIMIDHPAPESFIQGVVKKATAEKRVSGSLITSITLINTEIDEPCILYAVAEIDGVEYEVNRLRISKRKSAEPLDA